MTCELQATGILGRVHLLVQDGRENQGLSDVAM